MQTPLRAVGTLTATCLAALLAGCSGSDESEPDRTDEPTSQASKPTSAPPTPAANKSAAGAAEKGQDELRAAVTRYSDAFLTGDGATAYGLLSDRCQDRMSEADFTAMVDQAGDLYGSALPLESYDAEVSGDLARVTYTYSVAAINQDREPWVREGGAWHEDDC